MPLVARAVALPPSTWVALAALPGSNPGTIFGLAVNPANSAQVIVGDSRGLISRSDDSGSTWSKTFAGKAPILTISYDPLSPNLVVAGTQGGGVLVSTDAGAHWNAGAGLEKRSVRAVAFAQSMIVAGTDRGVYSSSDGASWDATSLGSVSINAVAVAAVNQPVRIFAGGESGSGSITLYESTDGGATWSNLSPPITGTIITRLSAGPLPPGGTVRPLIVGTNTGLFISSDDGATFTALSGAQLLPSIDYTQAVFATAHFDRFYVASDGGAGGQGGVWATADSGQHFSSLQPPVQSITALAVSADEQPVLYVATFRAIDHQAMLWGIRDTGGAPQGPFLFVSPSASAARTNDSPATVLDGLRSLASSQVPYIAVGVIAIGIVLLAAISHLRSRRR
jgi:photosystem II stability/assembly factor-like uncharacterized protein